MPSSVVIIRYCGSFRVGIHFTNALLARAFSFRRRYKKFRVLFKRFPPVSSHPKSREEELGGSREFNIVFSLFFLFFFYDVSWRVRRRNREGLDSRTKRIIIDATTVNLGRFTVKRENWMPGPIKNMQSFLKPRRPCLSRLREMGMEILFVEFLFAIFFFFFLI